MSNGKTNNRLTQTSLATSIPDPLFLRPSTEVASQRATFSPFLAGSRYDKGLSTAIYEGTRLNPLVEQAFYRGQMQSKASKLFNGFVSRGASILPKLGSGIISTIGLLPAALSGDITKAWDNSLMEAMNSIDESLKEALPAHISRAYAEGNWFQKMGTASFWANDGFDGLAFLASAAIPGAAFSKIGSVSSALRASKYGKQLSNFLTKTSRSTGVNTANALTTAYNTIAEASMEAFETNQSIRDDLARAAGFQSFDEMPDTPEKEAIKVKAGEASARTFAWNAVALIVPNYVQSRWFTRPSSELFDELKTMARHNQAVSTSSKEYLKEFGKASLSEGLWEENIQSAIQAYERRRARGETDGDAFTGPLVQALKNAWGFTKTLASLNFAGTKLGTDEDEAGSAIALGALLGGGMSVIHEYYKDQRKLDAYGKFKEEWQKLTSPEIHGVSKNLLIANMGAPYTTFGENEDGSTKYLSPIDGRLQQNPNAVFNIHFRNAQNKSAFLEKLSAVSNNDPLWIHHNDEMSSAAYAFSLMNRGISKEDAKDLMELDFQIETEAAKQLGKEDYLSKQKDRILKYFDMYEQSIRDISSSKSLENTDKSNGFDFFMGRNLFYLRAKKASLQGMQTTNEKTQESIKQMVDDIDTTIQSMIKNRESFRELYDLEVDANNRLVAEIAQYTKEAKNDQLTEADRQDLEKKKSVAIYRLMELEQIYGTKSIEYGDGLRYFQSDTFQAFQPTTDATRMPNFKNAEFYEYGKRKLNEYDLEEEIQNLANNIQPDQDPEDIIIDFMLNKDLPDSQFVRSVIGDIREGLESKLTATHEAYRQLELMEEQLMADEERNPDEVFEEANAIQDQILLLNKQETLINSKLSTLDDISLKIEDNYTKLLQEQEALSQLDAEDQKNRLIKNLADARLDQIEDFIAEQNLNKDKEAEKYMQELAAMSFVFTNREDIPQGHKDAVLKRIKSLMDSMVQLLSQINAAKMDRQIKQQVASAYSADKLNMLLNLRSGDGKQFFRDLLASVFGDKWPEIEKFLQSDEAKSSHLVTQAIYNYVVYNASKDDLATVKDGLEQVRKRLEQSLRGVSKLFSLVSPSAFRNLTKYAADIILSLDIPYIKEQLQDFTSPYFKFSKDRDLAGFVYEISKLTDDKEVISGMTKAESELFNTTVKLVMMSQAIEDFNLAFSTPQNTLDIFYKYFDEMLKDSVNPADSTTKDKTGIPVSAQQLVAITELVQFLQKPLDLSKQWDEFAVLTGVLGSGKSTVGAKHAVNIWKQATGLTEDSIIAFGHSATSSQVIGKQIYSDNTSYTVDDFMSMNLEPKHRLLIVDEALAMDNDVLIAVHNKVRQYNKSNPKAQIKILALGDRSQVTAEDPKSALLAGLGFPTTNDSSALSVVYRTSIPSIFNTSMTYKDRPTIPQGISTVATMDYGDAMNLGDTSSLYGVIGGFNRDNIIQLASKSTARSKVVIVNNEAAAINLRRLGLPAGVQVLNYKDAQSGQWDEVYIIMEPALGNFNGDPFRDNADFNSAMYTTVGRAKSFVAIASSATKFSTVVDPNLATSLDKLDEDVEYNYNKLAAELASLETLRDILGQPKVQKATPRVEQDPKEVEEEIDSEQNPAYEEESGNLPEQDSDTFTPPADKDTKVEQGQFTHSFVYPSYQIFFKDLNPDTDLFIFPVKANNDYGYEYYVAGYLADEPDTLVTVAILGAKDLTDSQGLGGLLKEKGSPTKLISPSKVNISKEGYPKELINDFILAKGKLDSANSNDLTYIYRPYPQEQDIVDNLRTPIEDTIATWWYNFFDQAAGGLGIDPGFDLYLPNGQMNWNELSKYMKVKIFSNAELKAIAKKPGFKPSSGIPYLVINIPRAKGSTSTISTQYIRLEPRRWGQDSRYYKTLSEGLDRIMALEVLMADINLKWGDEAFNKLVKDFGYLYEVQVVDKKPTIVRSPESLDNLTFFKSYRGGIDFSTFEDRQLNAIANILDDLVRNYTHGYSWEDIVTNEEQAAALKAAGEIKSFKKFKNNQFKLYDEDGSVIKGWVLSTKYSLMQKAINALALANKDINGVVIRTEKFIQNSRTGFQQVAKAAKSIMEARDSVGKFYNELKAYMINALEEAGYEVPRKQSGKVDMSTNRLYETFVEVVGKADPGAVDKFEATQKELASSFIANRFTSESLRQILALDSEGFTSARTPLFRTSLTGDYKFKGFNDYGNDLSDPLNLQWLNSTISTRFVSVSPTRLTGIFGEAVPTKQEPTPEQKPSKVITEVPTKQASKEATQAVDEFIDLEKPFNVVEQVTRLTNKSNPEYIRQLATAILPGLGGYSGYLSNSKFKSGGFVSTDYRVIVLSSAIFRLSSKGNLSLDTEAKREIFLHEAIHAVTHQALLDAQRGNVAKDSREYLFYLKMKSLMGAFEADLKAKGERMDDYIRKGPSGVNVSEFIANLSNPKFRNRALKVKVNKQNLVDRVIDEILTFLGFAKSNVYDLAFQVLKDYITQPTTPEQVLDQRLEQTYQQILDSDVYEDLQPEVKAIYNSDKLTDAEKYDEIIQLKQEFDQFNSGDIAFVGEDLFIIESMNNYTNLEKSHKEALFSRVFGKQVPPTQDLIDQPWVGQFFKMISSIAVGNIEGALSLVTNMRQVYSAPDSHTVRAHIASRLFTVIWDRVLMPEQKTRMATFLKRDFPHISNYSAFQVRNLLAELFATGLQPSSAVIRSMFRNLSQMIDVVGANWQNVESFIENFGIGNQLNAASSEAGTEKFILENFGSTQVYRLAQTYVFDKLYHYRKAYSATMLVMNKEEVYRSMLEDLNSLLANTIKQLKKPNLNSHDEALLTAKLDAYKALLGTTEGGLPVVYHMIKQVYPNWQISGIEELEEFLTDAEVEDADENLHTEGISKHIQDPATIDTYSRLSDSVKEFFTLIPNPFGKYSNTATGKYLSSKFAFLVTAEVITTYLDLAMDWKEWNKATAELYKVGILNDVEKQVVKSIEDLKRQASVDELPSNIRFFVLNPKFGSTQIGVVYDETNSINLDEYDFNYYSNKVAYAKAFSVNTQGMYDTLQADLPKLGLSIDIFNKLYKQAEAVNTLAELNSTLGSLTVKSYKYILQRQEWGVYEFAYLDHTGFGLEQALFQEVRLGFKVFHDNNARGIGALVDDPRWKNIVALASKEDPLAVEQLVEFLGLSVLTDKVQTPKDKNIYKDIVETDKRLTPYRAQSREDYDINEILRTETSLPRTLSNILKQNNQLLRDAVIIDASGNRIYRYVPISYFYQVTDWLVNSNGSSSLGLRYLENMKPDYLNTEFMSENLIMKGINEVHKRFEHDALKNDYTPKVTSFVREDRKDWMTRVINAGFLDKLAKNRLGVYDQFIYQPADKPRVAGATMNLLGQAELLQAIEQTLVQYSKRDNDFIRLYQPHHTPDRFLNFSVINSVAAKQGLTTDQILKNPKKYSKAIYDEIATQEGARWIEELKNNEVYIPGEIGKMAANIKANPRLSKDPKLMAWAEGITEGQTLKNRTKATQIGRMGEEVEVRNLNSQYWDIFLPLIETWAVNNYINGRAFNELFLGPMDMYANEDDIVKRIAGSLAPGQRPYIAPDLQGLGENFTVGVAQDRNISDIESMREFFRSLTESDQEVESLMSFFDEFKSTDAQGFMLPSRWSKLNRAYGASYRLANTLKPVYFGVSSVDDTKGSKSPAVSYLKYSSAVLTDDLVSRFPGLKKLRDYMELNGLDELLFGTAIKLGKVSDKSQWVTFEKIANMEKISDAGKMVLSNKNFKLQLNPRSDVDGAVSLFTQLTYFLNIGDVNDQQAQDVYDALAYLTTMGIEDINVNTKKAFASAIRSKMTSPGTQRIAEIMSQGISPNNPSIVDKAVAYTSALFESNTVRPKFKGAKLVQQTDEFISKGFDPSLEVNKKFLQNPGRRLQFVKSGSRYYAEVIVPASMLTPEMRDDLKAGRDTFMFADGFGYRIPSTELHSAVPIKIVGVYDSVDTNMIIAPYELVYLLGSDFDVDSLFTITREKYTEIEKKLLGTKSDYVGYEKVGGTYQLSKNKHDELLRAVDTRIAKIKVDAFNSRVPDDVTELEIDRLLKIKRNLSKKFAKNLIIDTMLDTITKQENRDRMLTPIALSIYKNLKDPDSIASYLNGLGVWPDKLTSDLSYAYNNMLASETVKTGGRLVGAYANLIKDFAYLSKAGKDGSKPLLKEQFRIKTKIDGKTVTLDRPSDIDIETGKTSWLYLDALVNLAIDNIKEQALYRLGINLTNGNTYGTLIALGMPVKTVAVLFKTPIAQQASNTTSFNFLKRIQDMKDEIIRDNPNIDKEKVLSRQEIEQLVTNQVPTNLPAGVDSNTYLAQLNWSVLDILEKGTAISSPLFDLSQGLNVVRRYPSRMSEINNMHSKLNSVMTLSTLNKIRDLKLPDTNQGFISWSRAIAEITPTVEAVESFPFEIPNLLKSRNILAGAHSFLTMRDVIMENLLIHSKGADKLIAQVDSAIKTSFNEQIDKEHLRREMSKYFISSVFGDKITSAEPIKIGPRTYTGMSAFSYRLAAKLQAMKILDKNLKMKDNTYELNKFLQILVIDYPEAGSPRIRIAEGSALKAEDIIDVKRGFERLSSMEVEEVMPGVYKASESDAHNPLEPTKVQDELVAYAALSTGFRLSNTSFTSILPTRFYKDYDNQYTQALARMQRLNETDGTVQANTDFIASIYEDLEMYLHLSNIKVLDQMPKHLKPVKVKDPRFDSIYKGYEAGIFFDRKYENVTEQAMPKFFVDKYKDDETKYEKFTLFVRISEAKAPYVYYQKVSTGLKGAGYFTDLQPYSVQKAFDPARIPLFVADTTKTTVLSRYNLDINTAIRLVDFNDPSRRNTVAGSIKSKKEITNQAGEILHYEYEIEPDNNTSAASDIGNIPYTDFTVEEQVLNNLIQAGIIEIKDCN